MNIERTAPAISHKSSPAQQMDKVEKKLNSSNLDTLDTHDSNAFAHSDRPAAYAASSYVGKSDGLKPPSERHVLINETQAIGFGNSDAHKYNQTREEWEEMVKSQHLRFG